MAFRKFDTHENLPEQQREGEATAKRKRVAPEIEQSAESAQQDQKTALPLEWRKLAPFIEAQRSQKPTEAYLSSFWSRLRPRLRRAIRRDELVREYLRDTFWRRWALRTATAALLLALAYSWNIQRSQMDQMRSQMNQMQQQIQTLKGGK